MFLCKANAVITNTNLYKLLFSQPSFSTSQTSHSGELFRRMPLKIQGEALVWPRIIISVIQKKRKAKYLINLWHIFFKNLPENCQTLRM